MSFEDLHLGPNWEPTPNPLPRSSIPGAQDSPRTSELTAEELAEEAEQDPLWRAADGTRYEAMLMLPDGTSYGRRGAAPQARPPEEATVFEGNNPTDAPEDDVPEDRLIDPEGIILGGSLPADRRARVTSTTGFPESAIGAMNETSAAGFTYCTATKIGPRALITASHCVMKQVSDVPPQYSYDDNGFFHPGQTNSSHPNSDGPINYAGAYWRDWRNGRHFDYSIVFTEDTWESVSLGWLSVTYFTDLNDYVGIDTRLLGYPKKTSDCLASALSNKNCDGWMYRDREPLDLLTTNVYRQLRYDIDSQPGQSGASAFTNIGGVWRILGVHWGHEDSDANYNRAARFRSDMWNDVCEWIESFPSTLVGFNCN